MLSLIVASFIVFIEWTLSFAHPLNLTPRQHLVEARAGLFPSISNSDATVVVIIK